LPAGSFRWRDVEDDARAGDGFGCLQAGPFLLGRHAQPGQASRGAGQVIRVVGTDPQLDQVPNGRRQQPQLPAGVGGAEPAVRLGGEPEVGVVGGGFGDVRHPDGDR
jgi:hypothetical protein